MRRTSTGLWRHPEFLKLWVGESVSLIGSQVTLLAIPLLAAVSLGASPLQMGTLGTLQYIPWLLIGLFAGAWVDRTRRRLMMIVADLGRAFLLAIIPLAGLANALRMEHLYAIGFLVGTLNVVFEVAIAAYLPTLIPPDRLVEGNSMLQASGSVAEIVGPGIGGGLVQLVTAPLAIAADSISFVFSAISLTWIRKPEPDLGPAARAGGLVPELFGGLGFVFTHPILRAFSLTSAAANFCIDMHLAVFVLFATREMNVSPLLLGTMYGVASLGGLIGSLMAGRLVDRIGLGRAIVGGHLLVVAALTLIPLSAGSGAAAIPVIVIAEAFWGFGAVVYVVNSVSLRQAVTPNEYQGRVAASLRFVSWGVSPLGFLVGGLLGETLGLRTTLLVAGYTSSVSLAFLFLSPVWRMRGFPPADDTQPQPVATAADSEV